MGGLVWMESCRGVLTGVVVECRFGISGSYELRIMDFSYISRKRGF